MSLTLAKKKRPIYLNLFKIRLPLPGWVSILHRLSGIFLYISIYLTLWLLEKSLASAQSFEQVQLCFAHPFVKLVLIGFLWALLHHTFAGIRFLLLDIHQGIELRTARRSSLVVLIVSLGATLWLGIKLW